jgi:ADP-ribose pyrophosphatase YjhB (NUDIX family)
MRQAARAVLLDPDDHVLLVRFVFPKGTFWALPGGGLDEGESVENGLRRELREELGLTNFELGPHIWNREHVIPMPTGHDGQQDQIHLVRVPYFEPHPAIGWELMRAEHVHDIRWWTIAEVGAAAGTTFVPGALHDLLVRLIAEGVPSSPVDTGV